MKNILFVIDNLDIGGVEKSLITLLNEINKSKYNIDVLPLYAYGEYKEKLDKNRINVLKIPNTKYDSNLISRSFKSTVVEYLKKIKIKKIIQFIELYIRGMFSKNNRKLPLAELIRCSIIDSYAIIDKKYDIAIAYIDRQYSYYVTEKVKADKKIMWIHSDYDALKINPEGYSKTYSKFDNIICVSRQAEKSFIKKFPDLSKKIIKINNILDMHGMDVAEKVRFNNDSIKLITVGRLSSEKGILNLIEMFYKLKQEINKKTVLYIIGDGPEKNTIREKIKKYKIEDDVILLGKQRNPYKYIKGADLYVQPSMKEGYCLTVYEALYLKKYVISYNVADISEVVENSLNGYLCNTEEDFLNNLVQAINLKKYKEERITITKKYNDCIINQVETILDK